MLSAYVPIGPCEIRGWSTQIQVLHYFVCLVSFIVGEARGVWKAIKLDSDGVISATFAFPPCPT